MGKIQVNLPSFVRAHQKDLQCTSTAGVERLFSVAGYLNSSKRISLTDDNFEKLLFGHVNFELCDRAARKRKVLDE